MTNRADLTPPATPAAGAATPPAGAASATPPAHWSRGALNNAGRLISTAANDDLVRNMINSKARSSVASTVFGGTVLGAIAARIATRSVPGALLVGGALLAKAVYEQRKTKKAEDLAAGITPAKRKV